MYAVELPQRGAYSAWRDAARRAISHSILPENIDWTGGGGLFPGVPLPPDVGSNRINVPYGFLKLAESVVWHSAPERFDFIYKGLWAIARREGDPLSPADPIGHKLHLMAKSVRRDIHKMHAFVRFKELESEGDRRKFVAWFEPEHFTLEPGSGFFAKRFADMDWVIATPYLTARYTGDKVEFSDGMAKPDLPDDASEALWGTYFANIFNPARVKLDAMRAEMPKKYWHNMPETRLIPSMLADAEARVQRMREATASEPRRGAAAVSTRYRAAMPKAPELPSNLDEARRAALQCRRCDLCEAATQTVWGEGAIDADLMIVGEQPGDQEDLSGRPFVGPAGQLLHGLMANAGVDSRRVWMTNAVKHFKFKPQGKRRLHQSPNRSELDHCKWWLGMELAFVQPKVVMALGASAAFALTGNDGPMTHRVGHTETGLHGGPVLISWHPSYILRLRDETEKRAAQAQLAFDLQTAISLTRADQS